MALQKCDSDLVENNMRLVYKVINEMGIRHCDDTIQEGMLGLCVAAKNFDKEKGIQFSTYAYSMIQGHLKHYLRYNSSLIKPLRLKNSSNKEELKFAEIAYTEPETMDFLLGAQNLNLDSQIYVNQFIDNLDKREQVIVNGLLDGKSQQSIGDEIGISQVQVCRTLDKIRRKLRMYNNELSQ